MTSKECKVWAWLWFGCLILQIIGLFFSKPIEHFQFTIILLNLVILSDKLEMKNMAEKIENRGWH